MTKPNIRRFWPATTAANKPYVGCLITLVALGALAACGQSTTPQQTPATPAEGGRPPTTATASADPVTTLTIDVRSGEVTPAPDRFPVKLGDKVRITVTSDVPDAVHLHGYDIEKPVSPGRPAVLTFRADQPGLFELETHEDPVLILTQVQVR